MVVVQITGSSDIYRNKLKRERENHNIIIE